VVGGKGQGHDFRNARLQVQMEQDRDDEGRSLADEDGFVCRTCWLRAR